LSSGLTVLVGGGVTVIATDRNFVIVMNRRMRPHSATRLRARLPRGVRLGPPSGRLSSIDLDERYWVSKRYYPDVIAANAALAIDEPSEPDRS
jgi:hypothetical protein